MRCEYGHNCTRDAIGMTSFNSDKLLVCQRCAARNRCVITAIEPADGMTRGELLAALTEILYPGGDLEAEWNGADVCDAVARLLASQVAP